MSNDRILDNGLFWTGLAVATLGAVSGVQAWRAGSTVRLGPLLTARPAKPKPTRILWRLTYFEPDENSDKFWEVWELTGTRDVLVRWGRQGTKGQSQIVARDVAEKRRDDKLRKGYKYESF